MNKPKFPRGQRGHIDDGEILGYSNCPKCKKKSVVDTVSTEFCYACENYHVDYWLEADWSNEQ